MTSDDLDLLVTRYEAAAVRHGSASTARAANRAAAELLDVYRELRARGEQAIMRMLPLLNHSDHSVRCWVAAHTLEFAPEEAEKALRALAAGPPGAIRATASMTLQEWRKGHLKSS